MVLDEVVCIIRFMYGKYRWMNFKHILTGLCTSFKFKLKCTDCEVVPSFDFWNQKFTGWALIVM